MASRDFDPKDIDDSELSRPFERTEEDLDFLEALTGTRPHSPVQDLSEEVLTPREADYWKNKKAELTEGFQAHVEIVTHIVTTIRQMEYEADPSATHEKLDALFDETVERLSALQPDLKDWLTATEHLYQKEFRMWSDEELSLVFHGSRIETIANELRATIANLKAQSTQVQKLVHEPEGIDEQMKQRFGVDLPVVFPENREQEDSARANGSAIVHVSPFALSIVLPQSVFRNTGLTSTGFHIVGTPFNFVVESSPEEERETILHEISHGLMEACLASGYHQEHGTQTTETIPERIAQYEYLLIDKEFKGIANDTLRLLASLDKSMLNDLKNEMLAAVYGFHDEHPVKAASKTDFLMLDLLGGEEAATFTPMRTARVGKQKALRKIDQAIEGADRPEVQTALKTLRERFSKTYERQALHLRTAFYIAGELDRMEGGSESLYNRTLAKALILHPTQYHRLVNDLVETHGTRAQLVKAISATPMIRDDSIALIAEEGEQLSTDSLQLLKEDLESTITNGESPFRLRTFEEALEQVQQLTRIAQFCKSSFDEKLIKEWLLGEFFFSQVASFEASGFDGLLAYVESERGTHEEEITEATELFISVSVDMIVSDGLMTEEEVRASELAKAATLLGLEETLEKRLRVAHETKTEKPAVDASLSPADQDAIREMRRFFERGQG